MRICPSCGEANPPRFPLCGYCGTPLVAQAPVQEVRKTVTVVFSDLKGSTNLGEHLDSESLREVMTRYFDEFRRVLERHGGTVEKFIGDAVMAVFGLPRLHEDDALRAVRAARDMQHALAILNDDLERGWGVRLANRTGVNTGEVVAGDVSTGQRLVTGDIVNVAARLEQAAPENEILIGEPTYRLVRDAVRVEAVEPLELKGKSEPVPAYRLLSVLEGAQGFARRVDTPMVGRQPELKALQAAYARAGQEKRCQLVTVLGSAGVGKSRLIHEFLSGLGDDMQVLRGQCLPYGEGITFWALATAVSQASGASPQEPREIARGKLDALVGPECDDVAERIAAIMGLSEETFPLQETFWGVRRFLETLASHSRVVVVVFDDIHWAESTFLDLIEHICDSVDAPLVVVCPARQELLDERPEWGAGRSNATQLRLEALSVVEGEQIIANLLGTSGVPPEVQSRLTRTSEGNPLFVEQTLSMLIDDGLLRREDGQWVVTGDVSTVEIPPNISALVCARLDRLAAEERTVMERASVIGQVFYVGALREMSPQSMSETVSANLTTLTAKELVGPDGTSFADEDVFAFLHIVIRDSAYSGLLKRTRAELHEQFVGWLERVTGSRAVEYEEIIGYHLEQAYQFRSELGPLDEAGRTLAARASERLASAGRRALVRRDMPAAVNLLSRAVAALDERDKTRLALIPDLAESLIDSGEFAQADSYLEQAITATSELGDERLHADAQVVRMLGRMSTDPEGWSEAAIERAEDAIVVLSRYEDHCALAKAWRLLGSVHGLGCQYSQAEEAMRHAVEEARLAGDRRQELQNLPTYAMSASYGPTPVPEAIQRCQEILTETAGFKAGEALVLCGLAHLQGLAGHFKEARESYRRSRALYDELALPVHGALVSLDSAPVELLACDPAAAERELRRDYETLERLGEKSYLSTTAALLAQTLHEQGRDEEAEQFTHISEETSSPDDVNSEVEWRCARAKILAARGVFDEAERLARAAVEQASHSDFLEVQGNAHLDLAEVLALAGRGDEASMAAKDAIDLYERKQSTAAVRRAHIRLENLHLHAV